MLPAGDVIDLVGKASAVLMRQTVFATPARALDHQKARGIVYVTRSMSRATGQDLPCAPLASGAVATRVSRFGMSNRENWISPHSPHRVPPGGYQGPDLAGAQFPSGRLGQSAVDRRIVQTGKRFAALPAIAGRTHGLEIAAHSSSTSCHRVRMFPMATRMVNLPFSAVCETKNTPAPLIRFIDSLVASSPCRDRKHTRPMLTGAARSNWALLEICWPSQAAIFRLRRRIATIPSRPK